jgi:hypothetical protein
MKVVSYILTTTIAITLDKPFLGRERSSPKESGR